MFNPDVDLDDRPDYVGSRKRRPGETLDLVREERLFTAMLGFATATFVPMGIAIPFVIAGVVPPLLHPAVVAAALFVCIGVAIAVWNLRALRKLNRGYWAERTTGEYLNGLERRGARVLHDLPGDGFNVDHLVLHRSGVYVVETKAVAKAKGRASAPIVYRDGRLSLGGKPMKGDPITQVRASCWWVRRLLDAVGVSPPVRGVVLFPGRFVEGKPAPPDGAWILSVRAFPKWLENAKPVMSDDEVRDLYRRLRLCLE